MVGSFRELLDGKKEKEYFKQLTEFIDNKYATKQIFPARENVMNSMKYTSKKQKISC